jgi:hypothetical protein
MHVKLLFVLQELQISRLAKFKIGKAVYGYCATIKANAFCKQALEMWRKRKWSILKKALTGIHFLSRIAKR